MIDFGHCCHCAFASAAARPLLDADGGRDSCNQIDIRARQLLHELPSIDIHRIEEPPLTFRKQQIESQRAFTRAAYARHHDEFVSGNR